MTCANCGHPREVHNMGPCYGGKDCTCRGDFSGYGRICTCKPAGDWSGPHYGLCTFASEKLGEPTVYLQRTDQS